MRCTTQGRHKSCRASADAVSWMQGGVGSYSSVSCVAVHRHPDMMSSQLATWQAAAKLAGGMPKWLALASLASLSKLWRQCSSVTAPELCRSCEQQSLPICVSAAMGRSTYQFWQLETDTARYSSGPSSVKKKKKKKHSNPKQ
ncbi:hypothetical protein COO60DRAFT_1280805 [Scenedesmus sp. NREL 46B-D3]|nr:hypothetical protein COO60DRAFT_1280805 [Scenedesmus sp. NREL 46B-D3]